MKETTYACHRSVVDLSLRDHHFPPFLNSMTDGKSLTAARTKNCIQLLISWLEKGTTYQDPDHRLGLKTIQSMNE